MKTYLIVFLVCSLLVTLNANPEVVAATITQEKPQTNATTAQQDKNVTKTIQTPKVEQNTTVKTQDPKVQQPKIENITTQTIKIQTTQQTIVKTEPIKVQVKKQIPLNTDEAIEQPTLKPLDLIIQKQTKQRQSVNMIYDNYHGYPFAIVPGMELTFYLEYPTDELIKGEAYSFFIQDDNTIISPSYQSGEQLQLVTLQIWQSQPATLPSRKIFEKNCLTQMGIEFQAKKNTKYILKVINPAEKKFSKMVQLALSHKHLSHQILNSENDQISKGFKQTEHGTQVLKNELTSRLRHIEQVMVMEDTIRDKMLNTSTKYFGYAIWEILLFGVLMAGQVAMVNRIISKSFSSIV